jgi:hypothetical protein
MTLRRIAYSALLLATGCDGCQHTPPPAMPGAADSSVTSTLSPVDGRILKGQLLSANFAQIQNAYLAGDGQIDLDNDGRPDWFLSRAGSQIVSERIDLDHDGHDELEVTRGGQKMTEVFDWNSDGVADAFETISLTPAPVINVSLSSPTAGLSDEQRTVAFDTTSGNITVSRLTGSIKADH